MRKTGSASLLRRVWLICCCTLLFSCTVAADTPLVVDEADLFSQEAIAQLDEQAAAIQEQTGMTLLIATIDDAEGKTAEAYADDYFDASGYFDGAALLIDMDNRIVHISTSGGMLDVLNDSRVNELLDDAYASVSEEAYEEAAQNYLSNTLYYIEKEQAGTSPGTYALCFIGAALLAMAIAGGVIGIIAYRYRKDPSVMEYSHENNGKLDLRRNKNTLVNSYVTSRQIPKDNDNNGGTTTHTSSSGNSHGGGGRSF